MKGKIDQWNDEKGFGFIKPDNGSEKLFFHVSSVKTNARRPQVGDEVFFESMRDSQQRLKAKSVVIEGVSKKFSSSSKERFTQIEPPKKNAVDYILMLVCLISVAASFFEFYHSGIIQNSIFYGAPAVLAFLFLNRQKQPKEKWFICSGCKKTADYDSRTIQAWNKGSLKLYCRTCHLEWLRNNPRQNQYSTQGSGSGCLGIIILMVTIPVAGCIGLYQWLS